MILIAFDSLFNKLQTQLAEAESLTILVITVDAVFLPGFQRSHGTEILLLRETTLLFDIILGKAEH